MESQNNSMDFLLSTINLDDIIFSVAGPPPTQPGSTSNIGATGAGAATTSAGVTFPQHLIEAQPAFEQQEVAGNLTRKRPPSSQQVEPLAVKITRNSEEQSVVQSPHPRRRKSSTASSSATPMDARHVYQNQPPAPPLPPKNPPPAERSNSPKTRSKLVSGLASLWEAVKAKGASKKTEPPAEAAPNVSNTPGGKSGRRKGHGVQYLQTVVHDPNPQQRQSSGQQSGLQQQRAQKAPMTSNASLENAAEGQYGIAMKYLRYIQPPSRPTQQQPQPVLYANVPALVNHNTASLPKGGSPNPGQYANLPIQGNNPEFRGQFPNPPPLPPKKSSRRAKPPANSRSKVQFTDPIVNTNFQQQQTQARPGQYVTLPATGNVGGPFPQTTASGPNTRQQNQPQPKPILIPELLPYSRETVYPTRQPLRVNFCGISSGGSCEEVEVKIPLVKGNPYGDEKVSSFLNPCSKLINPHIDQAQVHQDVPVSQGYVSISTADSIQFQALAQAHQEPVSQGYATASSIQVQAQVHQVPISQGYSGFSISGPSGARAVHVHQDHNSTGVNNDFNHLTSPMDCEDECSDQSESESDDDSTNQDSMEFEASSQSQKEIGADSETKENNILQQLPEVLQYEIREISSTNKYPIQISAFRLDPRVDSFELKVILGGNYGSVPPLSLGVTGDYPAEFPNVLGLGLDARNDPPSSVKYRVDASFRQALLGLPQTARIADIISVWLDVVNRILAETKNA